MYGRTGLTRGGGLSSSILGKPLSQKDAILLSLAVSNVPSRSADGHDGRQMGACLFRYISSLRRQGPTEVGGGRVWYRTACEAFPSIVSILRPQNECCPPSYSDCLNSLHISCLLFMLLVFRIPRKASSLPDEPTSSTLGRTCSRRVIHLDVD